MGENVVSKSDLRNLFGSLLGNNSTASSSREASVPKESGSREDYRKSNQALVMRNCQLKLEVNKMRKEIETTRLENESLRDKLCKMELATEDERIEMIVAQRVERRMKQMNSIIERSIRYMQKTSEDLMGTIVDDDEQENIASSSTTVTVNKRKSAQKLAKTPSLRKVDEAPLHTISNLSSSIDSIQSESIPSETPRISKPSIPSRRGKSPVYVRPRTPKRKTPPHSSSTVLCSSPPPPSSSSYEHGMDSSRRKRSAALKISSFKEPSLSSKIRRPVSFDPRTDFLVTVKGPEENHFIDS